MTRLIIGLKISKPSSNSGLIGFVNYNELGQVIATQTHLVIQLEYTIRNHELSSWVGGLKHKDLGSGWILKVWIES